MANLFKSNKAPKEPVNTLFKSKQDFIDQLRDMCQTERSRTFEECTDRERFLCLARLISQKARHIEGSCCEKATKQVYYFSSSFCLARSWTTI